MREITLTERLSQLLIEKKISGEANSMPTPEFAINPSRRTVEAARQMDSYTPSGDEGDVPVIKRNQIVHEEIKRDVFLHNQVVDSIAKKMLRLFYSGGAVE